MCVYGLITYIIVLEDHFVKTNRIVDVGQVPAKTKFILYLSKIYFTGCVSCVSHGDLSR